MCLALGWPRYYTSHNISFATHKVLKKGGGAAKHAPGPIPPYNPPQDACKRYNKLMQYPGRLRALLTPPERATLKKLSSPEKIQDYLDTLPINFEVHGETCMSPRMVLRKKTAHCIEGAFLAAAALAYHGKPPLVMDFRTIPIDEDHVVTLFRQNGYS